jgi:hypothetical protein
VIFEVQGQARELRWTLPAYEPGVRVTIEPAAAVAAGAQWRLDDGPWRESGERLTPTQIDPYGARRIAFKALPGWATAPNFTLPTDRAAALTVSGVYRLDGYLPTFDRQPQSVTTTLGAGYVTISARVTGSPSPVYQWFKDGVAVPKATRTSITFDKVEAAHVGTYVLQASNVFGIVLSEPAKLIVPGIGPSGPFDTWIASQQLPADQTGPNDDPDRDGIPNVVEFAMALDPKAADARPVAIAEPVIDQNEVYLGYVYRRPKDASGSLRYVVTSSRSLERWENLPTQTARVIDRGAYEEVVVRTTAPMGQAASGFILMRVERP